jgi:hypothetical protein
MINSNTQHNVVLYVMWHYVSVTMLSVIMLSITMLSVIVLSINMLSVIVLSISMLSVTILSFSMLSVTILSFSMLSVSMLSMSILSVYMLCVFMLSVCMLGVSCNKQSMLGRLRYCTCKHDSYCKETKKNTCKFLYCSGLSFYRNLEQVGSNFQCMRLILLRSIYMCVFRCSQCQKN